MSIGSESYKIKKHKSFAHQHQIYKVNVKETCIQQEKLNGSHNFRIYDKRNRMCYSYKKYCFYWCFYKVCHKYAL